MADMMHPPFRHSDSNCLTGVNTAETLLYALTNQDEPLFTSAISGAEPDDVSAVSVSSDEVEGHSNNIDLYGKLLNKYNLP